MNRATFHRLGILRIGIGIALIIDWIRRWLDFDLIYQPILNEIAASDRTFSLFRGTRFTPYSAGLGWLLFVFEVGLLLGWRTRICQIACLIGFSSLLKFNYRLLYEGDSVLFFTLFWSAFLPLGKALSIDWLIKRDRLPSKTQIKSWAVGALKIQFAIAYVVGFFWRVTNPSSDWLNGTALYYGVRYDCTAWGLSSWIQSWPLLLTKVATWISFITWSAVPCFALLGHRFSSRARSLFVGGWILSEGLFCTSAYMGDYFFALLPFALFLLPESQAINLVPSEEPDNRLRKCTLMACGALQLLSLSNSYFYLVKQSGFPITFSSGTLTLLELNDAFFPPQYWRIHAFAPRYDTEFHFVATSKEGVDYVLDPILEDFFHWKTFSVFPALPPSRLDLPSRRGRHYDRFVYNFLWYLKKFGTPFEQDRLGFTLKFLAENRFTGLSIRRIQWKLLVDITPELPLTDTIENQSPPVSENFRDWSYPTP